MHALFVHGMGRSPISGWPMLARLRRAGWQTSTLGYWSSFESVDAIRRRLVARIARIAADDDYVLIGHSLGGVLLRLAIADLPAEVRRPTRLFLVGSPVRPSRLARRLGGNPVFRRLTRECGELLGSDRRMAAIGVAGVPTTGIAGVRGWPRRFGPFAGEINDGVVALAEVSAGWLDEQVQLPIVHTWLPASGRVAELVLARAGAEAPSRTGDG